MSKRYNQYDNKLDWLKRNKKFSFYFDDEFFNSNTDYIRKYLETMDKQPNSSQSRTIGLICDLSLLYSDNIQEKFIEYKNEKSAKKKLEIRYGKERAELYSNKLKNRPKVKRVTCLNYQFWMNKGLSYEDAKKKVSELQIQNSKKKQGKIFNYKLLNPICVEYWKNIGYTDMNEIEQLRRPHLDKCSYTPNRFIEKYGEEEGMKRFRDGIKRRHNTMVERYGSKVVSAGVSKESLKFLIKLYKIIRKNGIPKSDVVWGIAGKKEFVMTDFNIKKSYFYDFIIKSKKIIIEYNNTFWHPREDVEWKGLRDYEEQLKNQEMKEELAKSRGYDLYYVWNDDDLVEKITYLSGVILNDRT